MTIALHVRMQLMPMPNNRRQFLNVRDSSSRHSIEKVVGHLPICCSLLENQIDQTLTIYIYTCQIVIDQLSIMCRIYPNTCPSTLKSDGFNRTKKVKLSYEAKLLYSDELHLMLPQKVCSCPIISKYESSFYHFAECAAALSHRRSCGN